jgi:hypothetical protein
VLHQDVAGVFGELGVFHLQALEAERAALAGDGVAHGRRAEFVYFRR